MSTDTLSYRVACRHVDLFADESELMKQHFEAMECRDCEDFLQLGIDAFRWLVRADEIIRSNVYQQKADYDPELDQALETLFVRWLEPSEFANEWIASLLSREFTPDNLDQFRKCEEEVAAIARAVAGNGDETLPDSMRRLRDEAITEHKDGKTAEFFSD